MLKKVKRLGNAVELNKAQEKLRTATKLYHTAVRTERLSEHVNRDSKLMKISSNIYYL